MTCSNATTPPPPSAGRTTGCGTGTPGTTPATRSAAGCDGYKEQVFLFTRNFAVNWTNNVSERGAKAAKRHQAVSGYWHSLATLARWCRLRSYLDSAAAHGITALDAIRQRHRRQTLATATARHQLTSNSRHPVNGHVYWTPRSE